MGFFAGVIVVFSALYFIGSDESGDKVAAKAPSKAPSSKTQAVSAPTAAVSKAAVAPTPSVPQATVNDPRRYLTVDDVKKITGRNYSRSYVDMKYNGKPDLTFSTTDEGHVVLTVTVLRGSDYEKFYSEYRSQDYKPLEYAFWGPKNENPPRMLWFRKGGTTIVLIRYVDAGAYDVSVEMMEKLARTISTRL